MKVLYKNLQRFSATFMAFSHSRNEAQKPMGILVMVLAVYYGWKDLQVPLWVVFSIGIATGIGVTYGGWRIIRFLGMKITSLETEKDFAAETSAALVFQLASALGIPVSTTHTITSSIVGAGTVRRFSAVRWDIASEIVVSWILTLPATIILGWLYTRFLLLLFNLK